MSQIFRCDRCGEVYDCQALDTEPIVMYPASRNIIGLSTGDAGRERVDLCGTCTEQLEKWLSNKPFESEG